MRNVLPLLVVIVDVIGGTNTTHTESTYDVEGSWVGDHLKLCDGACRGPLSLGAYCLKREVDITGAVS